jgi:hypothetical protein
MQQEGFDIMEKVEFDKTYTLYLNGDNGLLFKYFKSDLFFSICASTLNDVDLRFDFTLEQARDLIDTLQQGLEFVENINPNQLAFNI